MRPIIPLAILLMLAACGGPSGTSAPARGAGPVLSGGGVCPDADPVRDGPFVDAIRARNARMPQAALTRSPADARAQAALAIITGRGAPDPDQAACFAPYF